MKRLLTVLLVPASATAQACGHRGELDTPYCDEDRNLIADPPKDRAKLVGPSPLIPEPDSMSSRWPSRSRVSTSWMDVNTPISALNPIEAIHWRRAARITSRTASRTRLGSSRIGRSTRRRTSDSHVDVGASATADLRPATPATAVP